MPALPVADWLALTLGTHADYTLCMHLTAGTLTLNKLSVDQNTILCGEGFTTEDVMK